MNQQSIVLVHYPFTDFRQTKLRPAIILSNSRFNEEHAFFMLCPITSQRSLSDYEEEIFPNDFSGNLKIQSFVHCDNIMSIEKDLIIDEIGKASPSLFARIRSKLNRNFD